MRPFSFPFDPKKLPENGIYFFYEQGEIWGHDGNKPRIVRIGTHKEGNFQKRIAEHYLLNASKMNFNKNRAKPSDRSIFRKNIGRALLNKRVDSYLKVWEIDFTKRKNKERFSSLRNIEKEMEIESEITRIIRSKFSFRFIEVAREHVRLGKRGLERPLIGTIAHCNLCRQSNEWLGRYSPKKQIRESGLWLVHHLKARGIDERDKMIILETIGLML